MLRSLFSSCFKMEDQSRQAELPTPNSTNSYWHREPSEKLLGHRTTEKLPSTADVVVIGSGISGAFAARELVAGGRNVVMLEAREACWGATGRNGGHCQPAIWPSPAEVARFELSTFRHVRSLIEQNQIPCDFHIPGGIHALYTPDLVRAAELQMKRLEKHADLRDKAVLLTDKDELARRNVPGALAAVFQPYAAKLWPYKLVVWILEQLLEENDEVEKEKNEDDDDLVFNLQTHTPVTRLERRGESWIVHTSRGAIQARDVLLATNAYTSAILPALTDMIVPVRGQVCALEPPAGNVQLPHSYGWTDSGGDNYLVHRWFDDPSSSSPTTTTNQGKGKGKGALILGGERLVALGGEEGVSADDSVNPEIGTALRHVLRRALKLLPEHEPEKDSLRAAWEWTGIMGFSRDGLPWVGRVPASLLPVPSRESAETTTGLWIAAGYTGHGMPVAPGCGIAVARMILGKGRDGDGEKEGEEEHGAWSLRVPEAWALSDERIAGARGMELPRTVEELIRSLPVE